ncbi:MAG: glycosyltransferase family 39 protein [Myxococcaceae bacterium]
MSAATQTGRNLAAVHSENAVEAPQASGRIAVSLNAVTVPLAVWALFWTRYAITLPLGLQLSVYAAFIAGSALLLRDVRVAFSWQRADTGALGALAAVLFAAHASFLNQPLGGDELYHAHRAAFGVSALGSWADALRPVSREWAYAVTWRRFDVRTFAVEELWRAVSFGALVLLVAATWWTQRLSASRRRVAFWVSMALFAALGVALAPPPENHPPLRLLFPFVSHLVFGLSDWAFRVPSLLTSLAVSFALYRFIAARLSPTSLRWAHPWAVAVAAATAFIPVVFYVAEAVEASIYGHGIWVAVLLSLIQALTYPERARGWMLTAGVVTAFGALFRQPTAVLWLAVGATYAFLLLTGALRVRVLELLQTFGLGLVAAPYFLNTRYLGHVAVNDAGGPPLTRLAESLRGGLGPVSILNNTTLPWIIAFVVALVLAVPLLKRGAWVLTMAIPAYAVYFTIWPYLWGVGRYQAEYVTPFVAVAVAGAAGAFTSPRARGVVAAALGLLSLYTVQVNGRLNQDTGYQLWPQMRITTTAYFPYETALRYVQRSEAGGAFAFVGGSPWYAELPLWTSGFNFTETRRWRDAQATFTGQLGGVHSLDDLAGVCRSADLRFLLVKRGSKRELQHRSGPVSAAVRLLEQPVIAPFLRDRSYEDAFGGILDVYRCPDAAWGP